MLQQTQVTTVLGYYEKFLAAFPDVQALARASQEQVLALWSGLGYYSRARNLHACAKAVVQLHGGVFPQNSVTLQTLPGIGRSTAAAVAAFCFGERVAILDGNVKRVLTRYLAFADDLAVAAHERALWQEATALLPQGEGIEAYTQGVMDLGATVCTTRAPTCLLCPVQASCAAKQLGSPERFPVKTRKLKRSQRSHVWLVLRHQNSLWLSLRPNRGVWAGLWSLPEFDSSAAFETQCEAWSGSGQWHVSFKHVLTHVDLTLQPVVWHLPDGISAQQLSDVTAQLPAGQWVNTDEALLMGLPAPLRKFIEQHLCHAENQPPVSV
jgi:A/G-specific adenine glycosylase